MEISSTSSNMVNSQFGPQLGQPAENIQPAEKDKISMSREALLLTEALRAAQNAPDVRTDKVASLKSAIENGTYNINARLIAERIAVEEISIFI